MSGLLIDASTASGTVTGPGMKSKFFFTVLRRFASSCACPGSVEAHLRGANFVHVTNGPIGERTERLAQRPPQRRERILDARRHFRKDLPLNDAVALHIPQRLREHL